MSEPRPILDGLFTTLDGTPRLVVGRCPACRRTHFPMGPTCPYCSAGECASATAGPNGRLWLYTVVNSRPPGYRGAIPYGFGIVELDGGLRVVSRLTESDVTRLRPQQPVHLVIDTLATDDDGTPVLSYAFGPEPQS